MFTCTALLRRAGSQKNAYRAAVRTGSSKAGRLEILSARALGLALEVTWKTNETSRFEASWLRHNCHCLDCRQRGSGQKTVHFSSLGRLSSFALIEKGSPRFTEKEAIQEPSVKLSWTQEAVCRGAAAAEHVGFVPVDLLRAAENERRAYDERTPPFWTTKILPSLHYTDLPADSRLPVGEAAADAMWTLLEHLVTSGICLVRGVPNVVGMVAKVASLIAPVQKTIYGETFDVVSASDQGEAINIAYTSAGLAPHMDLAYYESAPGLQLLHCLRFDQCVEGGESTFIDAFFAAEKLRQLSPVHYDSLTRIPATFQKIHYEREQPVEIKYQRPHITENHRKQITSITWAPAFEGPLLAKTDADVRSYYEAYAAFAEIIHSQQYLCQQRLQPGDLVIFNNRRLLHGRNSFALNGGQRFLQGCYVHIDEFRSKVNVFARCHSKEHKHYRVFNQCCL